MAAPNACRVVQQEICKHNIADTKKKRIFFPLTFPQIDDGYYTFVNGE
jgi:hypothetical protein